MLLGLLAAGFTFLFGAGRIQVQKFEHIAAQEINSKLTQPGHVEIHTRLNGIIGGPLGDLKEVTIAASGFKTEGLPLFTEPDRSKKGIIRLLKIDLSDFWLSSLRIQSLAAQIPDCRYDYALALSKNQVRLSHSGTGTGSVKILEKDLENFILKKFAEIKKVAVKIDKDKVFVDGYGEFLIINTNFTVIATLGSPDGKTLELQNARIFFDGKAADPMSAKVLLDKLNPVVDLNEDLKLYDAISVRGIKLRDGILEAWGDTKIPIKP